MKPIWNLTGVVVALISHGAWAADYSEDFQSGLAQGWEPSAEGEWAVIERGDTGNRVYRAYSESPTGTAYVSTYAGAEFGDLDFAVTVRNKTRTQSNVLVRAQPGFTGVIGQDDTGYVVALATSCRFNGDYPGFLVYRTEHGVVQTLTPHGWRFTEYLRCDPAQNRVRVIARGGNLRLFINNHQVFHVFDVSPLPAGRIGLLGYVPPRAGGGIKSYQFDDVSVIDLTSAAQRIGNAADQCCAPGRH
jgi:hypothetical protein